MSERYFPLKDEAWEDELFDEIQKGDRVWYKNNVGQVCKAKAVMRGPAGWVIKSQYRGVPQVVQEDHNYLGHTPARGREPDHFGDFLYGDS